MGWTDDIADMLHNRGMACSRTDDMAQWRNDDGSIYRIYRRLDSSRYDVMITEATLDQVIEMTLGRGECEWVLEHSGTLYDKWRCSKCGLPYVEPRCDQGSTELVPKFCPGCGRRVKR